MSIFASFSEALHDALASVVEWSTRGRLFVFVQPNMLPVDPALWMMEYTSAYELRKLTVSYLRTPTTGVPQDAAQTTHHFLNLTAGVPDASWITADYTAVETAFDTFWTAMKPYYAPTTKLSEYVWRADGPAFKPFGASLSPTLRRAGRSVVGTSASQGLPPQAAMTVTEVTASTFVAHDVEGVGDQTRNRWGRFYMPAPAVASIADGRINSLTQTTLADAVETFYETCVSAGLIPVMYSPTTGHAWSVLEIHVDDIFDVIRSRRYDTPLARAPRAITQP